METKASVTIHLKCTPIYVRSKYSITSSVSEVGICATTLVNNLEEVPEAGSNLVGVRNFEEAVVALHSPQLVVSVYCPC